HADLVAEIAVRKAVVTAEFDAPQDVRRPLVQVESDGNCACRDIEHRDRPYATVVLAAPVARAIVKLQLPSSLQQFNCLRGKWLSRLSLRKLWFPLSTRCQFLPQSIANLYRTERVRTARLDRKGDQQARLSASTRPRQYRA